MKKICKSCGKIFDTDESGIDEYCPKCGSENIIEYMDQSDGVDLSTHFNWSKEQNDIDYTQMEAQKEKQEREYGR